jgi:hypothetical protein
LAAAGDAAPADQAAGGIQRAVRATSDLAVKHGGIVVVAGQARVDV